MAILNMIAANNWERPIYIDHSLLYTGNIFFLEWLQFEGLAYRFVPIKSKKADGFDIRVAILEVCTLGKQSEGYSRRGEAEAFAHRTKRDAFTWRAKRAA